MSCDVRPFGELFRIPLKNGLTRPSRVRGTGIKMINMGELFAHDRIGNIDMELVPVNEHESETMLVEEGDLLFARQSLVLAGAGRCSIVASLGEPTTFESHIIRVRLKKDEADPFFFYYYFKSEKCGIRSIVTQGVQAGIRGSDLQRLPVRVPPITIQRSVATALSAYDDLIANNERRICLLEKFARLLYREWFVRLKYPGHELDELIDGVPEGWQRKRLGDTLTLKRGYDLPERIRADGDIPIVSSSGVTGYHSEKKAKAPGIVTGRYGTLGVVYYIDEDYWPLNTALYVSDKKGNPPLFLVHFLETVLKANPSGKAAVPGVNRNDLHSFDVLYPPKPLRDRFQEMADPIYRERSLLLKINQKLVQARDLFLPRLMDGRISV